ncbi:ankyrin repeat-containing domain protein [Coniella lustricola]|uniref:Ankyrin repeat-containing domain protein n=1 Tax=Coniella lustricola TaxID=2025994 RepID=A0A2T3A0B7_9PEZI|nr:ankyrin repeat-containing domain protein [Coniella lustricola]
MSPSNDRDDLLERRRLQNRMAQRRFRQRRQNNQQEADKASNNDPLPTPSSPGTALNLTHLLDGSGSDNPQILDLTSAGGISLLESPNHNGLNFDFDYGFPQIFDFSADDTHHLQTMGDKTKGGHGLKIQGSAAEHNSAALPTYSMASGSSKGTQSSSMSSGSTAMETQTITPPAESRPPTPYKCDASGRGWLNAIHMAAQRGQAGILQTLLQQEIDSNDRDSDGFTPLMHSVANGHQECVRILLENGAQVTALDHHLRSSLHWAVKARREVILRMLLKHADQSNDAFLIDSYDDSGHTPLHGAIDSGFQAGVSILLEFGANVHSRAKKA